VRLGRGKRRGRFKKENRARGAGVHGSDCGVTVCRVQHGHRPRRGCTPGLVRVGPSSTSRPSPSCSRSAQLATQHGPDGMAVDQPDNNSTA
jgi:hypothetical protein